MFYNLETMPMHGSIGCPKGEEVLVVLLDGRLIRRSRGKKVIWYNKYKRTLEWPIFMHLNLCSSLMCA